MPTVPRYGDSPQVRPAPLAGARLTAVPAAAATPASEGAGVGEAMAQFGETTARIGANALQQVLQVRRQRADQAAVLSSQRQLGELEHTLLNDPERGAFTVKGKDTLDLYTRVGDDFDRGAGAIEQTLTNDRQRIAFAQMRDARRNSLLSSIDGYVLREMDSYEKGEAQASLQTAVNLGIANAGNAPRIREELDRIDTIVDQYAGRLGLTGPEARAQFLTELRTKLHQGVIAQLLTQDRDQDAQAYFDAVLEGNGFGKRPDGSVKGDGFFGALVRPDGGVMSEYSIADSEQLKDANGQYRDYPTLVPTLTKAEVDTLLALKEGEPVPEAIKRKAEAFALERQREGKPLFAQPGEQDTRRYPELRRHYGQQLSGEAIPELRAKLETASTDATGLRTASSIWDALGPATDQAPINFDAMEAKARELAGDNPKVYKATIGYLRERYADTVTGRKERLDARDDAVWTQVLNDVPFSAVRRMPEFVALEGKDQATIRDYYTRQAEHVASLAERAANRAAADESRAYTRQLHAERLQEMNGWARYGELSDPAKLRAMSRADILRELPTLGPAHVNRLLTDQEQLSRNDAALKAATIDRDEFTTIATQAGIDYAAAPKTVGDKATIAQLYDRVKDEIAKQQSAKGRVLTREEKQTVMQNLVDEKVRLPDWGVDDQYIGAAIGADQRGAAYVPLSDIDARPQVYGRQYQQALNYLRGLTGNQALTDAQLRAQFKDRIQKAIGRSLAGGTRAEIENALKGVD